MTLLNEGRRIAATSFEELAELDIVNNPGDQINRYRLTPTVQIRTRRRFAASARQFFTEGEWHDAGVVRVPESMTC